MGVFVVGMHRSGTSAATRLLNLMGAGLGDLSDLIPPDASNPTGHWESWTLTAYNDILLGERGGMWKYPPRPSTDWSELLARRGSEASRIFRLVNPREPWCWKDPRNCLNLPFWSDVV